jgi:ligand-binding SRPBCC domain-containing protein
MVIETSTLIHAPLKKVWDTFTDLTCWEDWSSFISDVSAETERLTKGKRFKFCIRPFDIPVNLEPVVKEIVSHKRIVWIGKKHGISARHEFTFQVQDGSVHLTSKETFSGRMMKSLGFLFPKQKIRELSDLMLKEIKHAAESDKYYAPREKGKLWEKKSKSE